MATYFDILDAVKAVIVDLPVMSGRAVRIRRWPAPVPLLAELRGMVVAPNEGMEERVAELTFGNRAHLEFDVYCLWLADLRHDEEDMEFRDDVRLAVREALWRPSLSGVADVFDCDYNPSPSVPRPPNDNMVVSGQLFTYKANLRRASP